MITLLGAAPDTGNQGVSALCRSAVAGIRSRGFDRIAVADHGRGARRAFWWIGGEEAGVDLFGLTNNRRLWRGDCLRTVSALARLGGLGNSAARRILGSRAVLDVSGGDSFTDLYGEKRFQAMCRSKRLALDNGRPLILLPQTLGPFRDPQRKAEAVDILRRATAVWVRDQRSFDFLKDELGADFDPARHHLGVDMAVLLPETVPAKPLPDEICNWLHDDRIPVAGINVNGLLYQRETEACAAFGLAEGHRAQASAAARAVLDSDPAMRLLLVPHVNRPEGDAESDWSACRALEDELRVTYGARVATLPQIYDACELKWIIARCDWFAGARMHSTIASFSSGVPTLGFGYSDKAEGVFAECGIEKDVADLRVLDAQSLGRVVRASLRRRSVSRKTLKEQMAFVRARAGAQMDMIADAIRRAEG